MFSFPFLPLGLRGCGVASLVPTKVDLAGTVGTLFYQRLVKLSSCPGVDIGPAELAVVLKAGDISTKKRSKLPSAKRTLTFITQLVIQDVGLHLHLRTVWIQTPEVKVDA